MKKWILVLAAALAAWNIWLSVLISRRLPSGDNGTVVVENTVNGYETDITDAVASAQRSLVTVTADDKEISGIIYAVDDEHAYIFTDALITGQTPSITFDSGLSMPASLVGTDVDTSLTLLEADIDFRLTAISRGDSSNLKPGEFAAVVGSRRMSTGKAMVTYGVVSGEEERRMTSNGMYGALMIETDALTADENIGGALINAAGELQGMGVSHVVGGQDGMSYAISVTEMKNVYQELISDGAVTRGSAGITTRSLKDMASYEKGELGIDLDRSAGVIIENIYVDSPCRDIMEKGDIILSLNGETVSDANKLRQMLYGFNGGDTVTFHILRDGAESDVSVTLA